jgi:hypothetical protein
LKPYFQTTPVNFTCHHESVKSGSAANLQCDEMMPDCVHESGDEIDVDNSVPQCGAGSDGDLALFIGEVARKKLIGAVSALALMSAAGMALAN